MKLDATKLLLLSVLSVSGCMGPTPVPVSFNSSRVYVDVSNDYKTAGPTDFPPSSELTLFLVSEEAGAERTRVSGKNPAFSQTNPIKPQWGTASGLLFADLPEAFPRSLYERGDPAWARNSYLVLEVSQPAAASPSTFYCAKISSASIDPAHPEQSGIYFHLDLARHRSSAPANATLPAEVTPLFCEYAYFNAGIFGSP